MTDVASLGLKVESGQVVAAAAALDKLGDSATKTGSRVSAIQSSTDALIAALNRNTQATSGLTSGLSSIESASAKARSGLTGLSSAANDSVTNVVKLSSATKTAKADLDSLTSSATKTEMAWKNLGAAGDAVSKSLTPVGRLSNLSSNGSVPMRPGAVPPGQVANSNTRMPRADELRNLMYQGSDILSSASTASPGTILMQQGPQIAQMFGPGGLSVTGLMKAAGEGAASLAKRVGLVGGALGGLAAGAAVGVAAFMSYNSAQKDLERNLQGIGRASGATVDKINALAPAAAASAGVSVRSAREMSGEYAATGKIGTEMYAGLIGAAKNYAATTGDDISDANKELASAFSDLAGSGIDALQKKFLAFNDSQADTIRQMAASGNAAGAQKMALDILNKSLVDATTVTSAWGRVTSSTVTMVSDLWDKLGGAVDRVVTGGTLEKQLETAQAVLKNSQARQSYLPFGLGDSDTQKAQAELNRVKAEIAKRDAGQAQAQQNSASSQVAAIVKSLNPAADQLKKMQADAELIRTKLSSLPLDQRKEAESAMNGLLKSSEQLKANMAAGGEQFAASLRAAQFQLSQVGKDPLAQNAASIQNDIEERKKQVLAAGMGDQQITALQNLDKELTLKLEALKQQTVLSSGANGGRYSKSLADAPDQYRDAYYQSALKSGVNADLLVAQGYRESQFKANAVSPAGAKGIAQFMDPTALGIGLKNAFDPIESIMKQGELMAQLLKQFKGNETLALIGYNAGPNVAKRYEASGYDPKVLPDETRKYLKAIQTSAPGAEQMVKTYNALEVAQRDAGKSLEDMQKFYGKNGAALELAQAQQSKYTELLNQGVPAQQAASIAYGDLIKKTVEFGQSAKMVQFTNDNQFARDQIGRTSAEQAAYSTARSRVGDTTSTEAQKIIKESMATNDLVESKQMASSAMTGFVQDLKSGAGAIQALGNAANRFADGVISKVLDKFISTGFDALTKSGGGGLASLFGFADGGIMTSGGPLPLNMYAKGGVANSPQMAIFGEGRSPEAFVPLPDGRSIPVSMRGGGGNMAPSAANVNVQVNNTVSDKADAQVTQQPDGSLMIDIVDKGLAKRAYSGRSATTRAASAPLRG